MFLSQIKLTLTIKSREKSSNLLQSTICRSFSFPLQMGPTLLRSLLLHDFSWITCVQVFQTAVQEAKRYKTSGGDLLADMLDLLGAKVIVFFRVFSHITYCFLFRRRPKNERMPLMKWSSRPSDFGS